jgi:hypothetical protein
MTCPRLLNLTISGGNAASPDWRKPATERCSLPAGHDGPCSWPSLDGPRPKEATR